MTNREIALILFNIATLLELAHGNPYRIRAYRRAARVVLGQPQEVREAIAADQPLPELRGVGKRLTAKIVQLATEGRLAFYAELVAEQHPAIQALMRVAGIGPKTALRLFAELQVDSPAALLSAARRGRIRELWGFAERREAQLGEAAAVALHAARSIDLPQAA